MEVQNVSAQLFNKQLPLGQLASFTGCRKDFDTSNMTTCVDPVESDKQIENAFQSQLDISDLYKSKVIFEKMKSIFNTNEGIFDTSSDMKVPADKDLTNTPNSIPRLPVGPRDTIERFTALDDSDDEDDSGKTDVNYHAYIMLLIVFLIMVLLIRK